MVYKTFFAFLICLASCCATAETIHFLTPRDGGVGIIEISLETGEATPLAHPHWFPASSI